MRKVTIVLGALALFMGGLLIAHPHFSKTVTADLSGQKLTLNYTTYPFSESHLDQVSEGFVFHCGRATLSLTSDHTVNGKTIPAGEYLVRAKADSLNDWTLYLVPASQSDNSYNVSVDDGIALKTQTHTGLPVNHHLDLDLYSGHGSTDGKVLLAVAFGDRKVEAVLG